MKKMEMDCCPRIEQIGWNGQLIYFALSLQGQTVDKLGVIEAKIVARSSKQEYCREQLTIIDAGSVFLLLGTIDAAVIAANAKKNDVVTITLSVEIVTANEVLTAPCSTKKQLPGSLGLFTSGYYYGENAVLIPDESGVHNYVFRLIGNDADASMEAYAFAKRDRPLINELLLQSLSAGAGVTSRLVQDIRNRELRSEVRVDHDGRPTVHIFIDRESSDCEAIETGPVEFAFDLALARGMSGVTLLDEGKSVFEVTRDAWAAEEHSVLLDPLLEFDELCKTHGIEYTLGWGTLLGGVRHNGIIPWDHDVDLYMTLSNYKKLRALMDGPDAPTNRKLDDWLTYDNYPGILGRYMHTDTSKVNTENGYGHCGIGGMGISIDIFLLLPVKGTEWEARRQLCKYLVYDELFNGLTRKKATRSAEFVELYEQYSKRCDAYGREAVLKELGEDILGGDDSVATHYIATAATGPDGYLFNRDWLFPTTTVNFEGHELPIPSGYLDVLRCAYGPNFRRYPSGRSDYRYKHFRSKVVPYDVVQQVYLSECDAEKELQDRIACKKALMLEVSYRRSVMPDLYALEAQVLAERFRADLQEAASLPFEVDHYHEIDSLIDNYVSAQIEQRLIDWSVVIPVDDEYLKRCLEVLICYRGESGDALQMINIMCKAGEISSKKYNDLLSRIQNGNVSTKSITSTISEAIGTIAHTITKGSYTFGLPKKMAQFIPESVQPIANAVYDTARMRDCLDYGRTADAAALAKHILEMYPDAVEARCAELWLRIIDGRADEDFSNEETILREEIKRTSSYLPYVVLAKLWWIQGKHNSALALTEFLKARHTDGMNILHLIDDMNRAINNE